MWCRFNDEDVHEMKSKTLELGKEDDLEGMFTRGWLIDKVIHLN